MDLPPGHTCLCAHSDVQLNTLCNIIFQEYAAKNCPILPKIQLHSQVPDAILIENVNVSNTVNIDPALGEVFVDSQCGAAVLRGAHIFAMGILALSPGTSKGDLVSVYADLEGKCLRGSKHYSGEKYFLGVGILLLDRNVLFGPTDEGQLKGVGVRLIRPVWVAPQLDISSEEDSSWALKMRLFPQNLPSIVASRVLLERFLHEPPTATSSVHVLDMCAAPGGKTLHLCRLLRGQASLTAIEKSPKRMEKMLKLLSTWQMDQRVQCHIFDSRRLCSSDKNCTSRPPHDAPPFCPESFDYILLDAPCSALGQRPQLSVKECAHSENQLASYSTLQMQLLHQAVRLLKVGGHLVYCTCTTATKENENLVSAGLQRWPGVLELAPQQPCLRPFFLPHCENSGLPCVQKFGPLPHKEDDTLNTTDDPFSDRANYDTIGFFIAKFVKLKELE